MYHGESLCKQAGETLCAVAGEDLCMDSGEEFCKVGGEDKCGTTADSSCTTADLDACGPDYDVCGAVGLCPPSYGEAAGCGNTEGCGLCESGCQAACLNSCENCEGAACQISLDCGNSCTEGQTCSEGGCSLTANGCVTQGQDHCAMQGEDGCVMPGQGDCNFMVNMCVTSGEDFCYTSGEANCSSHGETSCSDAGEALCSDFGEARCNTTRDQNGTCTVTCYGKGQSDCDICVAGISCSQGGCGQACGEGCGSGQGCGTGQATPCSQGGDCSSVQGLEPCGETGCTYGCNSSGLSCEQSCACQGGSTYSCGIYR